MLPVSNLIFGPFYWDLARLGTIEAAMVDETALPPCGGGGGF